MKNYKVNWYENLGNNTCSMQWKHGPFVKRGIDYSGIEMEFWDAFGATFSHTGEK